MPLLDPRTARQEQGLPALEDPKCELVVEPEEHGAEEGGLLGAGHGHRPGRRPRGRTEVPDDAAARQRRP